MQLLQDESTQRDEKIFAWASAIISKAFRKLLDGKMREQIRAKHTGPTTFQQSTSLRAEMIPRIEQIPALMIA